MRVSVIGGGIIGLACAVQLRREGHAVTLFDAATAAREASWAAAGMLAPHNEAEGPGPLHALGSASLARWPQWLEALEIAPVQVDFRRRGSLIPVLDAEDQVTVDRRSGVLVAAGVDTRWLDGEDLEHDEPALAAEGALWLPAAQVDPRRCSHTLRHLAASTGVVLRYRCAVERIEPGVVHTAAGERVASDLSVLASGAWTPDLAAMSGLDLRGEPVKGQMLLIGGGEERLRHFVHCRHAYCVPRAGCGVVVGSTVVCSGFDRTQDDTAIEELAAGARRLFPHLAEYPISETWTGLRPRLCGGLPCIERVAGHLVLATGHFRNGILLTPITAEIVADLVAGRQPPCDLAPFRAGAIPGTEERK